MATKQEDSIHDQLGAVLLELDKLEPGTAAAFLLQAKRLLQRAKMKPPKQHDSHP